MVGEDRVIMSVKELRRVHVIPVSFRIDVACASANKATVRPAH